MREGAEQDLAKAELYLKSSVDQDGTNAETLVWLGRVYEKSSRLDEAQQMF